MYLLLAVRMDSATSIFIHVTKPKIDHNLYQFILTTVNSCENNVVKYI